MSDNKGSNTAADTIIDMNNEDGLDETDPFNSVAAVPLNIKHFYDDLNQDDLYLVGDAMLDKYGLNAHHLDSANNFYKNGIKQIITQGFKIQRDIENRRDATAEDRDIEWIYCEVVPTDIQLKPPTTLQYTTSKEITLYPKIALAQEKVYSGSLSFSCDVKAVAHLKNGSTIERTASVANFKISKVPIIKGSIACNTYGKSKQALMQMKEDPSDPGGYFIVRGEWAVDCTENITFNQPKIYLTDGLAKTRLRCEFISKPGDTYQNSDMLLIWFHKDDTLMIEIARDRLNTVQIPFFMLFRALGWSSDKEMLDYIVYDYSSKANKTIFGVLQTAMKANYGKNNYIDIYDQNEVLKEIVDMVPEEKFAYLELRDKPDNYHNAITDILRVFDQHCLPHIGLTDASRHEKLKFMGLLIRKLLMVHLGYIEQTDRDSYRNKRIHAAGDNYAKTFKTFFNQTVVMPIKRRMVKDFNSTSFSQVNLANLVKSPIYAEDFERLIVQTIISGNKSQLQIKKRTVVNRLATQLLNRKNQLNVVATMRRVSAPSAESAKQSERASAMRRVHNSGLGYICPAHSPPEGEKVGINKQLAMFATIAKASSSEVLKKLVLSDKKLIPEGQMSPLQIAQGNYARVFVNGHLLGYAKDSREMIARYRHKRRSMEINPHTTIYWDSVQNEVQFFVDIGRLTRPLMIVYNNQRDKNIVSLTNADSKSNFKQGIAVTAEDIQDMYRKTKTIDDLLREQKIEWIAPEEQQNCFICPDYNELVENSTNELKEYTHCDIPQAILGITALTAPYGNHNQAPRVTYQTTQAKQTCGHYAMNWPYRMDKEVFLQYTNEAPLIRTAVNKYLFPNGLNVMTAMMCYSGYNQEDSLIINKAARDRGAFDGSKFTYYKTELEQKDVLDNPDASKTDGLKSASYEKLVDGKVQKGDRIQQDDVLIGKYMPLPKGKNDRYLYMDKSIVYKESEPAIVHDVIDDRNEDDMRFCKVGLRKIRPVAIGDKFCLQPTAEVLTDQGWISLQDININKCKVATMDLETFKPYYTHATKKHVFDYDSNVDGKLINFTGDIISTCTPTHKYYMCVDGKYQFIEAKDIDTSKMFFHTKFDGVEQKTLNNINKTFIDYVGQVMCIEVPNTHLFYYRENNLSPPMWTGNSSRSGQKGICALLMKESDMPVTLDGIRPTMIFNPHGIPSRMTCAQLIESLYGNLCAIKGTHADGTMFKQVDIDAIIAELEDYGFTSGYERFVSGITGEYIDSLVFFGPTFYQRLQKFVLDAEYSVKQALTDAITHQPLAGQGSSGGLKVGEMEKDVLVSHGASRFLQEKFRDHSDLYDEYRCRCGRPAIVNHANKLYKCKYCGDNSDIVVHPTSWSSKLFIQEIESTGVGVNVMPRPFTYPVHDDEERSHSIIDQYDENSKNYIRTIQRAMVDDNTSRVDADVE